MAQTRSGHKPDNRLVIHIIIALLAGVGLALLSPDSARAVAVLGTLFVKALKAVAPLLVLVLVAAVIANKKPGVSGNMRPVMLLYLCGTLLAAIVGVVASTLFPSRLVLSGSADSTSAPSGIAEVLQTLLLKVVDNPVHALANGNFIGILAWAVAIGLVLQPTTGHSKQLLQEMAQAVSHIVKQLIRLAPLGIFGLVADNVASNGLGVLLDYSRLLLVLLGAMLFVALLVNPLLVYLTIRRNPYPLVFTCLRDSGVTAFFTRSSAANIPVNMRLCQRLGLDEDSYAVSIPLGATINMAGAAITISVLSLATVHTLGISVDIPTAILLCVVSSVAACGASGIAGGSLLLIPLACSLFGISTEVAMQVVAIGMMIGVVQDAAETALNSSTDVLFTAAAAMRRG